MPEVNSALIPEINSALDLELAGSLSYEELHSRLSLFIRDLINNDFEKLVYYLYRIDVNEQKLKQLLHQNKESDASGLIAELVIERQLQKIKSRSQFRQQDDDTKDEDKW